MSSDSTVEEGWDRHEVEGRQTLGGDSSCSTRDDEGLICGRGRREGSRGRINERGHCAHEDARTGGVGIPPKLLMSSGVMDSLGYPSRVENGERGGEEISRCVWEFQAVMSFKGRRVRRPWQSSG